MPIKNKYIEGIILNLERTKHFLLQLLLYLLKKF